MLGRLEMDVDDCIEAYRDLMKSIFSEKLAAFPSTGHVKSKPNTTPKSCERRSKMSSFEQVPLQQIFSMTG